MTFQEAVSSALEKNKWGGGGRKSEGRLLPLNRIASEKVIVDQRPKGSEIRQNSILRGDCKCKGPGVGIPWCFQGL